MNINQCGHSKWDPVPTPPDSSSRWYRCRRCKIYGFRRSLQKQIRTYKCGDPKGCNRLAVDRLPGRAARMGFKWRCGRHMGTALLAQERLEALVGPRAAAG